MTPRPLTSLRRIRWAVRATLAFGVSASVAANILHARQNPISEAIAGWPPLALLLTIELVSRVPVHRRALAAIRIIATIVISGIAAWVSYWHMKAVAFNYGETDASPYLLPVSVDGLIVVASISLVELAGRIRDAETATALAPSTVVAVVEPPARGERVQVPVMDVAAMTPPEVEVRPELEQLPSVDEGLRNRARAVVRAHQRSNAAPITVDQLAGYLRVDRDTAGLLHRLVLDADANHEAIGAATR